VFGQMLKVGLLAWVRVMVRVKWVGVCLVGVCIGFRV
jgi:hypothetical protein